MIGEQTSIDPAAIDGLTADAVSDRGNPNATEHSPSQDAGRDESIEKRLQRDPSNEDAQLDRGSDESMDASDPPSAAFKSTIDPPASSGYDREAEQDRAG